MENNTTYHFLGKEYNNTKELAIALANNYADGINYIFQDEFLEQFTDSYLKGRLLAEQKRAYYATSAFAVTTYLLNPDLGLVLSGRALKNYADVAAALDDDICRQACIHLFKDHSISHTIALKDNSVKNIFEIENNIDNKAVVKYFQLFYDGRYKEEDIHGYKKLDYYLMLATCDKDPFSKYLELVNTDEFEAILCQNYGVANVLEIYKGENYPYEIIELIKDDISIPLSPIAESGSHSYFFNTVKYYKNFKYKSVCKKLIKRGKKVAKKYRNNASLTLEDNRIYYDLYRLLVKGYDLDLVIAKSKKAELNLVYRHTRVNLDFIHSLSFKDELEEVKPLESTKKEYKQSKKEYKKLVKEYLKK